MNNNSGTNLHIGKVISINGEEATVTFERSSMCNHCKACGIKDEKTMEACVLNDVNAKTGDSVVVEMDSRTIVKASFIAYVIPLVFFLLGLVVGFRINEIVAIVLSLSLCLISSLILFFIDIKLKDKAKFRPHITKVLDFGEN